MFYISHIIFSFSLWKDYLKFDTPIIQNTEINALFFLFFLFFLNEHAKI